MCLLRKDTESIGNSLGPQLQFPISDYTSKCKICAEETEKYTRATTKLLTLFDTTNYLSARFRNLGENAKSKRLLS